MRQIRLRLPSAVYNTSGKQELDHLSSAVWNPKSLQVGDGGGDD
jgi:hypothetical protein